MAPSADPQSQVDVDVPPLPSPILTPTGPAKPLSAFPSLSTKDLHEPSAVDTLAHHQEPRKTQTSLATIPSDEDRSSEEDGSFRSSPSPDEGHEQSNTSSIADATPDVDEYTWHLETQARHAEQQALDEAEAMPPPPIPAVSTTTTAGSRSRSSSNATTKRSMAGEGVSKLTATEIKELAGSPDSLPMAPAPARRSIDQESASHFADQREAIRQSVLRQPDIQYPESLLPNVVAKEARGMGMGMGTSREFVRRPSPAPRTVSTPPATRFPASYSEQSRRELSPRRYSHQTSPRLAPIQVAFEGATAQPAPWTGPASLPAQSPVAQISRPHSPTPPSIPIPPMSLPTHLQLELAAQRPSPLYIHQSYTADIPYESSAVKFQRLKNVLFLPPFLERTLTFGALACLDAWLYTFTILPVRFVTALWILIKWWAYVLGKEARWVSGFVWSGLGRLWERERGRGGERSRRPSELSERMRSRSRSGVSECAVDVDVSSVTSSNDRGVLLRRASGTSQSGAGGGRIKSPTSMPGIQSRLNNPGPKSGTFRHRRTKSMPSSLSAFHKADLLQGAVIICSCIALMSLDASRMYHFIRAQSAIKLYVIYNILEVGDRLLSALGQDILECLFSSETLSRNASGRSKVLLPLGMFLLALVYNCTHSIALYYQVITLNVAVNSYSNALLTLLLSNQFVEIKSTVFKRFEKDNLFQLTCADIVERFQLWIMLLIIGMRNVVEVGGLFIPGAGSEAGPDDMGGPKHSSSNMPASFAMMPSWLMSGEVLSPFLIVVGSEMLVDTIKHAYVTKFNNIKPAFYSRILDILCKDYYTNAFSAPSLTRRLGLAVVPLSCLFVRASLQTYHMFLSSHVPMPGPPTTQTSLTDASATPSSPAVLAALNRFDTLLRDSLGRATYGNPFDTSENAGPRAWYQFTTDDLIALLTMVVVFFIVFLVLLICKLLLGMVLLKYARNRYAAMKQKEQAVARGNVEREGFETIGGRRIGGFGHVEVGEDRQRWIHADNDEGLPGGKGPSGGGGTKEKKEKKDEGEYLGVSRYEMVAKRIW